MPFDRHPTLAAAALRSSADGVLVLDSEGVVLACNPAAGALLGRPAEELEGVPFPLLPLRPGTRTLQDHGAGPRPVELHAAQATCDGRTVTVVTLRATPGGEAGDAGPGADALPQLREFIEHAEGVFFVASLEGRILYVSPGLERLFGRTGQEIRSAPDPLGEVVHPDDRDDLRTLLSDPERAPYETTYRTLWRDGTVRWIRQRGFPVTDEAGGTARIVGMLEDITEQREERELLTHTLRLLRRTVSSLQEGVLVLDTADAEWRILSANPAAQRMFGFGPEELVGRSAEMVHGSPDDFEAWQRQSLSALEAEGLYRHSGPLRRKDGSAFPAGQTVAWLHPAEGVEAGVVVVVHDLSEKERAEAELRESEERFRLIAERIDDVFWITSVDKDTMEYVSPAYEKVFGRSPEELYRDPSAWAQHLVEEDRERVLAGLHRQAEGDYEEEYRIRRPDGDVRWIWDRAFPVEDESGAVVRIIGVAEDITERKRAEERFGALSREITDVLYVLGPEGQVRFTSPSVRHTLGYSPEEFQGSNILALVHPEDRKRVQGQLREIQEGAGETSRAQYRVHTREGEVLHVESIARNLLANPAVEGIVVTTRDVTERLELEEQLLQSQKMEAIGRLAGGIAHDFNNLLTVIRAQTDLLLLDMDADDALRAEIETIQATGDRAAELTSQLLAFSRDQVLRPRVVDLSQVVRGMGTLLERIIGEDVEVVNRLPHDLPPVRVDPGQLEHVVMNLAINARDAMPWGGVLTLATSLDRVGPEKAEALGVIPGSYVALRVSDTGVGMDERTRLRIFEPFFTTKPTGEGTGLGLAMAHGVVHQSGGNIQVSSRLGEGTTFTLRFPAVEETAAEPSGTRPPPEPLAHTVSGTVLLVEDDDEVRRATTRILERAGLRVRGVNRADKGLVLLEEERVDIILTDLVLPGMSGRELVDRVHLTRPDLPIVVMSGYAAGARGRGGDLPPEVDFIQKPFDPAQLVQALRNALEPERAG